MSTRERDTAGAAVGARVARSDAIPRVTGAFAYSSDLRAAGMLHGATTRSPHVHARVRAVDVTAAASVPGVRAVLTHEDVPGVRTYGLEIADHPVLAIDRVRYLGEPVAIVAADDEDTARRAAALVSVDYEPLPPVLDPERAHELPPLHVPGPTEGRQRTDGLPNVVRELTIRLGDPGAEGDVSVSAVYDVGMQDQAFLGPESGLAVPDGEGGVDIYAATQWLHADRAQIAPCLALSERQCRLHGTGVGGAFGGREDLSMQIHAALLALRTGRPVRMVYRRDESFVGHVHRHPARIWMEHRATHAGDLVCVRARMLLDGGAYTSTSAAVLATACTFACGPYRVPNALVEGRAVYTNNPPAGAMRGFGAVQACIAYEAQMDRLAARLGVDPVELRLRNALEDDDLLPVGQRVTALPVREVIRRAAALAEPPPEPLPRDPVRLPGGTGNTTRGEGVRRGVGFAVGIKNIGFSEGFDDFTSARVRLFRDTGGGLAAEIHLAACEVGQGVAEVIVQLARSELGIEAVTLAPASTAAVGSAGSVSASRTTWMVAGALRAACRAALDEHARTGADVDVERTYRHVETAPLDPESGRVTGDRVHAGLACVAMKVVTEVDVELGLARVVWIGTAQDVGRAVSPLAIEGQIEGGTAQGIGLALMEEIRTHDGAIANGSFTDYLLPTALDVPPVEIELLEVPNPDAPYGIRGVGELPTVVSTAAVLSALRAASGRELTRVPARLDDLAGLA